MPLENFLLVRLGGIMRITIKRKAKCKCRLTKTAVACEQAFAIFSPDREPVHRLRLLRNDNKARVLTQTHDMAS